MSEKSKENLRAGSAYNDPKDHVLGLNDYPSLARLFEAGEPNRINAIRKSFENATRELDRIIRSGTSEEAARASKALTAIQLTLEFLGSVQNNDES